MYAHMHESKAKCHPNPNHCLEDQVPIYLSTTPVQGGLQWCMSHSCMYICISHAPEMLSPPKGIPSHFCGSANDSILHPLLFLMHGNFMMAQDSYLPTLLLHTDSWPGPQGKLPHQSFTFIACSVCKFMRVNSTWIYYNMRFAVLYICMCKYMYSTVVFNYIYPWKHYLGGKYTDTRNLESTIRTFQLQSWTLHTWKYSAVNFPFGLGSQLWFFSIRQSRRW